MPLPPTLGQAHVCQRCAARGPTCCEPEEGVALASLTPGDIRRIGDATGRPASDFVAECHLEPDEVEALEDQDPVLRGLVGADGILRSLAKSGRACVFHEAGKGCGLSYAARPLLCRRFPIVREGSRLRVSPGGDCLALEEAADMPALLTLLGIELGELKRIDRQLRSELR